MNLDTLLQGVDERTARLMEESGPAGALYGMVRYHLGWVDERMRPAQFDPGKRIRARICLLSCSAAGAPAEDALPAATSVELIHNFSLIHDDIQDRSETRRHRSTVWAMWGEAQAINAGDLAFVLAQLALVEESGHEPGLVAAAVRALNRACRRLCEGQFLDLEFERMAAITLEEYYAMIERKTAALLEASCRLGALYGRAGEMETEALSSFGRYLGLAFQAQDDYLGIWGDPAKTGKPSASDVSAKKKTLPILHALSAASGDDRDVLEAALGSPGMMPEAEVARVVGILERCGAVEYVASEVARWSEQALASLKRVPESEARGDLAVMCEQLAIRTR